MGTEKSFRLSVRTKIMVDYKSSPQVLEHLQKSLAWTVFDTKWIPGTSSFVAAGAYARGTIRLADLTVSLS